MSIVFKNIDTGETVAVNREVEGKFYRAKLSALMNSSNLSLNADRGQDYGWRLDEAQQAILEEWEQDPEVIDKVANFTKVMVDSLSHADFLAYMIYQQELGKSPELGQEVLRRENQARYEARVAELRAQAKPDAVAPFDPKVARGEATVEDFLNGDVTGDASGDKVVDAVSPSDTEAPSTASPIATSKPKAKK